MVLGFGHHSQRDANVSAESRGRDPFIATGRGGAGNIIRSPSRSRDRSGNAIPPQTAAAAAVPNHMISSGRGGAGNVRSPSRDPLDRKRAAEAAQREEKLQEEYRQTESRTAHLTGRGGAGNATSDPAAAEERGRGRGSNGSNNGGGGVSGLLRSLSRSRSREPRNSGKGSPNRSQSRPRASESSKLAQVEETRSSEEDSHYSASVRTATNEKQG
ncbi:hypothetical protein NDA11_006133 [Ustilago hordei]|uniref:Uncharacterized protein n=1 Tax=Ustilago hordei TaxID=120017 RepID=I2G6Z1_USTHO|nr:uncharacterized protein UHO2_02146 [Ustilago hordei]KAJ1585825.1 hypothetical protein NDA12_002165 [Ustilago hordei]KAJ1589323.1 hypothetical protein NDA15_004464 [Ustilago hordei]KAJ1591097.1 hypothetical protein NDA11_006133 [Ustilago hordei]CCF54934.1 uncharacterized protein UHOR_01480 [Ustilago hordei]SYW85912.1 uncharacterized protein UHO2_02146 [Ustilago hordei]